jgi:hypothetical protein
MLTAHGSLDLKQEFQVRIQTVKKIDHSHRLKFNYYLSSLIKAVSSHSNVYVRMVLKQRMSMFEARCNVYNSWMLNSVSGYLFSWYLVNLAFLIHPVPFSLSRFMFNYFWSFFIVRLQYHMGVYLSSSFNLFLIHKSVMVVLFF